MLGDVICELELPVLLDLEERIRQAREGSPIREPGASARLTEQVGRAGS